MEAKKQGGARPGSGRKRKEGYRKATFLLSDEALDHLDELSKNTLVSKNKIVNSILDAAFKVKK